MNNPGTIILSLAMRPFYREFQQRKICQAVALKKSSTMAAREHFLTQPAVTIQIQKMKKGYETRLFDRAGKRIFLTELGKILFLYAEKILRFFTHAKEALIDVKESKSGKLNIGASATVGSYYLPKVSGVFGKKYPNREIKMNMTYSHTVVEDVLALKNELGFVGRLHHLERLLAIPFREEELVLIIPTDHLFAPKEDRCLQELTGQPFIYHEDNYLSGTLRAFLKVASELSSHPPLFP